MSLRICSAQFAHCWCCSSIHGIRPYLLLVGLVLGLMLEWARYIRHFFFSFRNESQKCKLFQNHQHYRIQSQTINVSTQMFTVVFIYWLGLLILPLWEVKLWKQIVYYQYKMMYQNLFLTWPQHVSWRSCSLNMSKTTLTKYKNYHEITIEVLASKLMLHVCPQVNSRQLPGIVPTRRR